MNLRSRLAFSGRYAIIHLLVSLSVVLASAGVVFGLWYPAPYHQVLRVGQIYLLLLLVDVSCGPLLTLMLFSSRKSRRERWLDLSLIGVIQLSALAYGMFSVWQARPVALVFEVDRLVVVTANEVQIDALPRAPLDLQQLDGAGLYRAGTRKAVNTVEFLRSVELGLAGIPLAYQPDWWLPWGDVQVTVGNRAKPLVELIESRPADAGMLESTAQSTGYAVQDLSYLPLVSSKTYEWVALLDDKQNIVGHAPVDGF